MPYTLIILFVISLVSNLVYNAYLPLHVDEAYYWIWTKNPQLSYFDHPPMAAYFIKITTLFSAQEWSIHLGAVIAMSLTCLLIYQLAENLFSPETATYSFIIFLFLPLTQLGHQVMTPDPPLLLFWTSTLYFVYKAVFQQQQHCWYWAGISGGLMLLSKYTGILLLPGLFLFLTTTRYRSLLGTKGPYTAILLGLLVFSPVIIWNWQHDWSSFAYQFNHGMAEQRIFNPATLGEFIGGQLGLANPVFFLTMLYYTLTKIRQNTQQEKLAFLFWPFIFSLAFFTYTAMFKKAEANWPAPAYITGSLLLGYWLAQQQKKRLIAIGLLLSILLLTLVRLPEMFPFLPKELILKKQYSGYRNIMEAANSYIVPGHTLVLSDSYQNASMAWYYLEGQPAVYILTTAPPSNFDYWQAQLAGKTINEAVYIGSPEKLPQLEQLFTTVMLLDTLVYQDNYITRSFSIYRCNQLKSPLLPAPK